MISGYERYRRLIDLLTSRTIENKIDWEFKNSARICSAWLGSNAISLKKTKNSDEEDLYIVSINSSSGELLDSFDDEDISPPPGDSNEQTNYFVKIADLYTLIQRQVSGADAALDSILKDLEEGRDFTDIPF